MTARTDSGLLRTSAEYVGVALALVIVLPLLAAMIFVLRPAFLIGVPLLLLAIALFPALRRWAEGAPARPVVGGLRLPADVRLARFHAWLKSVAKGEMTIGVDDLLQRTFGPVGGVGLPRPGQMVLRGDRLFTLRSPGRSLSVQAPFSGRVVAVNESLVERPAALNEEPYGEGWIARLAPVGALEASDFHRGEEARGWLGSELARVTSYLSPQLLPTASLADGGEVSPDLHRLIDAPTWQRIREEVFGDEPGNEPA